jgi:LysM repeat protein
MAYVSGPYGIQYEQRNSRNNESNRIKWILGIVLVIVAVSFSYVKIKKAITSNNNPKPEIIKEESVKKEAPISVPPVKKPVQNEKIAKKNIPSPPPLIPEAVNGKKNLNTPSNPTVELGEVGKVKTAQKAKERDPWSIQVSEWLESAQTRSTTDRNLLERLSTAVLQKKTSLEIDSLEKLCRRPTLVDIKDPMLRRLGELNMKLFLSNEPSRWTTDVTVRRGDSLKRIAREHGTTLAAVRTLNKMDVTDRITVGDKLRVPEFPSAVLEVHKSLKLADLTLKGQFFKRYAVVTDPQKTISGPPYPITREAGPRTRFHQLKISMSAKDLQEMDMLLAPGSSLVVTEQ